MAEGPVPRYMAQLLEQLGWNRGTRIPLANNENKEAENLLISRYTFKYYFKVPVEFSFVLQ